MVPVRLVGVVQAEVAVHHLVKVAVGMQEAEVVPDWPDSEWDSYSGSGIYSHTTEGRCITRRDYWYYFNLRS